MTEVLQWIGFILAVSFMLTVQNNHQRGILYYILRVTFYILAYFAVSYIAYDVAHISNRYFVIAYLVLGQIAINRIFERVFPLNHQNAPGAPLQRQIA